MNRLLVGASGVLAVLSAGSVSAADPTISYVPKSLAESVIKHGPWTLHESADRFEQDESGDHFRHGRDDHRDRDDRDFFKHDASGIVPTTAGPPYANSGVPYANYCVNGTPTINHTASVMQPYYFPFVRRYGNILEGFFDYRPRNQQEAVVAAISTDWGASWRFTGKALALNPYCPWDPTDPDNLYLSVNGVKTAYGADSASAGDNGLGHPVVLRVNGVQRIYQLNRANGHIDNDPLVVHTLPPSSEPGSLVSLPDYGYVSPLSTLGYPALEPTAQATTGLQNPDAIMGAVTHGTTTTVIYVEKTLNADKTFPIAQQCPNTPAFALTNFVNGKPRKPNHDVTTVRVATTTDGLNFTDVGVATGLFDPTTVARNGTRWLGSGSIIRLSDGRYGMFFGAGNCLDNDSDGFHYIGYAETNNQVNAATDLLAWHVVYGFDNPILSTDTVVDPAGPTPYPKNAPVVNVTGAEALTPAQVAPFVPAVPPAATPPFVTPPGGYNSNFFSGRVYDPQALYTDEKTVTIVFAGYNTPQPSNNLGDYRTIGRFQLRFPAGYVSPF
ncbi:hypothetical protein [Bradyrhizobium genosp. A]|uniref:hypothetical protein n=1 Tax=Bradyrhizobium genosp. A TaxID=83626 RepID=UPI003CF8822C